MSKFTSEDLDSLQNVTELYFPDGTDEYENISISNEEENKERNEKLEKIVKVSIPETLNECPKLPNIKEIELRGNRKEIKCWGWGDWGMFEDFKNLTKVTIPDSVEVIGKSTFEGCENLTDIVLPKNLKKIESLAFYNCEKLSKLDIPQNIEIGTAAFAGTALENEMTMPTGTVFHTRGLQLPKDQREEFTIPSQYKKIGDFAFIKNTSIKKVITPKTITSIGDQAFSYCSSLESVELSDNIETIGENVFSETLIKSLKLPKNLKIISREAFKTLTSLESVEFPANLNEIEHNAFENCTSLKNVVFATDRTEKEPLKFDEEVFKGCTSLEKITVPEYVDICDSAGICHNHSKTFKDCTSLKECHFLGRANKYTYGLFSNCNALEIVTLPKTDKTISNFNLKKNTQLKKVILQNETTVDVGDLLAFSLDTQIVISEDSPIGVNIIEKEIDGQKKVIAREYFMKKSKKLLAVITNETSHKLSDGIKIISPNCFPPCVLDLEIPSSVKKVTFGDEDKCSKNLLKVLKEYTPEVNDNHLEKLKKEKISEIKAVGAGGLLFAKLQDCKFEFVTNPVTKPRVGTELEVKLPFDYKIKFFVPSKQKPTEKEPVENLLQAILVEVEADEFSELKILENINKKCDEYVEKTGLELTKTQGDVTEEYFRKLLKYKLGENYRKFYANGTFCYFIIQPSPKYVARTKRHANSDSFKLWSKYLEERIEEIRSLIVDSTKYSTEEYRKLHEDCYIVDLENIEK